MATAILPTIAPDTVISFEINPGTLLQLLESRAEKGPRLKCFEGSVTLVSPGLPHESKGFRLNLLIVAVSSALGIKLKGLASTTWKLPLGAGDTAYEADAAYAFPGHRPPREHQPPDLAIEIVVSHPATKALRAGALLKIPELWVLDIPRHRLTFYHLASRGKHKGTYRPSPRSRAFPVLTSPRLWNYSTTPRTTTSLSSKTAGDGPGESSSLDSSRTPTLNDGSPGRDRQGFHPAVTDASRSGLARSSR